MWLLLLRLGGPVLAVEWGRRPRRGGRDVSPALAIARAGPRTHCQQAGTPPGQFPVPHAVQLDQGVTDRHHAPVEPVRLRPQELLEYEVDELLLVVEAHERFGILCWLAARLPRLRTIFCMTSIRLGVAASGTARRALRQAAAKMMLWPFPHRVAMPASRSSSRPPMSRGTAASLGRDSE